jgi:hypothetical protein
LYAARPTVWLAYKKRVFLNDYKGFFENSFDQKKSKKNQRKNQCTHSALAAHETAPPRG